MGLADAHVVRRLGVIRFPRYRVTVSAPGKVNLALRVVGVTGDGYHELRTVFAAVSLCDQLVFQPAMGSAIRVTVLGHQATLIPHDGTDLTARAARLLRSNFGRPALGARITLTKSIPVAGGMAGGSADAAAALVGCDKLWRLGVPHDDLTALARELGADVPFGLLGGVAYGTGRGDQLRVLPVTGTLDWVLAFAETGLSTASVFAAYDKQGASSMNDTRQIDDLATALAAGDAASVGANLGNDLEAAAISLRPELGHTLAFGRAQPGVLGAVLSGSGPTCAFLVASAQDATRVAGALAGLPQVAGVSVVQSPVPGAAQ